MSDLISRQDAIEEAEKIANGSASVKAWAMIGMLRKLPSAESAQKTGEWIVNSPVTMKCDQCGYVMADWKCKESNYCPNCGASMRGEEKWKLGK